MDIYDKEIERLTANPSDIHDAWLDITPLFNFCTPSRSNWPRRADGEWCGCPTMIRFAPDRVAWTPELTDAIRADERIPKNPADITPAHLPIFAEWQRRIDKELGRTPPSC